MTIKDQMGNTISFQTPVSRIVSLVPSQTELLFDLGLNSKIKGITKFCIHPKQALKSCRVVGGTKQFHFDRIAEINPDCIIANKEENDRSLIESLSNNWPVYVSDVNNLSQACEMIKAVGSITGTENEAITMEAQIKARFDAVRKINTIPDVLYLIWANPWMAVGKETFIDAMMGEIGLENVIQADRYPILDDQALKALNPKYVILSSEPFPFNAAHADAIKTILPGVNVMWGDGEMFSWYGSRLLLSPDYFKKFLEQF